MIRGTVLADLLPHAGAMVLLDSVIQWDAAAITCATRSHLDPANPLRRAGRLAAVCAAEYALQAAALHGALLAGGVAQRAGYVARLRNLVLHADRLDDPALGMLRVEAALERQEANGMLYALHVAGSLGTPVMTASASIALPA